MAGKTARRGPGSQGGGGGKGHIDAGKILGAALGGGGENPAYGMDPSMTEVNPDIGKYGVDNPYKPLNWLGTLTGQQDYYSQYRFQKAVQDANFLHEKELQAIKNSDMTEQEKLKAANNSKLQRDTHIQAAMVAQGVIPTEQAQAAATATQLPLVPRLTEAASNLAINKGNLGATEADIANRRLLDPLGEEERVASLSAQDAAHAVQNEYQRAAAKKLGILELGAGSAAMPIDLANVPGQVTQNFPMGKPVFNMTTGQMEAPPAHVSFEIGGKQYMPVPRGVAASTSQLMSPTFAPGAMPAVPGAFVVTPSTDIQTGEAPEGPSWWQRMNTPQPATPDESSPYRFGPIEALAHWLSTDTATKEAEALQEQRRRLNPTFYGPGY